MSETPPPPTYAPSLTTERPYLHVQPADVPLRTSSVARSITRLHRFSESDGWFESRTAPTYEFLFVATGTTGPAGTRSLDWYVGVDEGDREALQRDLRQCLPPTYDVSETTVQFVEALGLPMDQPFDFDTDTAAPLADWEVAGLEFLGVGARADDWQLPLTDLDEFAGADEHTGDWPLASLLDGLVDGDAPALAQVLVQPRADWTQTCDDRIADLENGRDTTLHVVQEMIGAAIVSLVAGPQENRAHSSRADRRRSSSSRSSTYSSRDDRGARPTQSSARHDRSIPPADARRIEALRSVDTRQSFTVNARAVAFGTEAGPPERLLACCRRAFDELSTRDYTVQGSTAAYNSRTATRLLERVLGREMQPDPTSLRHKIPGTRNASPAIVAGPESVGAFCLTGAPALASETRRAVEATRPERTGIELPARSILNRYLDADGLNIGQPKNAARKVLDATVSVPPAVQPLHTAVFGSSGAGKSSVGQEMVLSNHAATDGADVYVDHKGDGAPDAYLRTHYAKHRSFEAVYYFDCEELLPALPVFTIEPQLSAGIDRQQAIENVADRHVEILASYMGEEAFHDAATAVDVVEALIKALFDPVHGADTISQYDLLIAAARMHRDQEPPAVSNQQLQEQLLDVTANSPNVFDNIMGAAVRRIRQATKDARLTPLFTHAALATSDAWFDFYDHLDEDCVIVVDTSGFREDPRRLLTLTIISELWTALKRRKQQADPHTDLPQVNLHLEEAADVATSDILTELLAQGRSFGVGVTVMMQFPEQVRDSHPRVYRELLNDVGTHVTGQVSVDRNLAEVFATRDVPAEDVADRIRDLQRGEWLVRPATPFADERPSPFVCESLSLRPGHPDGDAPLEGAGATLYDSKLVLLRDRMHRDHGLSVRAFTHAEAPAADHAVTTTDNAVTTTDNAETAETVAEHEATFTATIPHTKRLPDCVTYVDEPPYPLECTACDRRYPSSTEGMRSAITCCHDLTDIDRDDVPICEVDMPLTAAERRESNYDDCQVRMLAAVYMAHQQQFDPALEYDIVWDSMRRLQEYVGADKDDVDELVADGLLKLDCQQPYILFTVTPTGREELQISHREGVAHGDGQGDLSESSLHVAMAEAGRRLVDERFVADTGDDATLAKGYHEIDGSRLDAAALDDEGNVVAAVEAELSHNDTKQAVPADFDTMAACDPEAAIWVVKNRDGAHEVLQALNAPADGEPRVEKTYSDRMAPQDFKIDSAGLTDVYTFQHLRRHQLASDGPGPWQ